jgi:hypothetical protein
MTPDILQKLADYMNTAALGSSSEPAACNAYRDCAGRVQRLIEQAPPRPSKAVVPPEPSPETFVIPEPESENGY